MAILKATQDNATWSSKVIEQGAAETDWIEFTPSIEAIGKPVTVDVSSTSSILITTDEGLQVGDNLLIKETGSTVVHEFTIASITGTNPYSIDITSLGLSLAPDYACFNDLPTLAVDREMTAERVLVDDLDLTVTGAITTQTVVSGLGAGVLQAGDELELTVDGSPISVATTNVTENVVSAGVELVAPFEVTNLYNLYENPRVLVLQNGNIAVFVNYDGHSDLYGYVFDADGNTVVSQTVIFTDGHAERESVQLMSDGRILVAQRTGLTILNADLTVSVAPVSFVNTDGGGGSYWSFAYELQNGNIVYISGVLSSVNHIEAAIYDSSLNLVTASVRLTNFDVFNRDFYAAVNGNHIAFICADSAVGNTYLSVYDLSNNTFSAVLTKNQILSKTFSKDKYSLQGFSNGWLFNCGFDTDNYLHSHFYSISGSLLHSSPVLKSSTVYAPECVQTPSGYLMKFHDSSNSNRLTFVQMDSALNIISAANEMGLDNFWVADGYPNSISASDSVIAVVYPISQNIVKLGIYTNESINYAIDHAAQSSAATGAKVLSRVSDATLLNTEWDSLNDRIIINYETIPGNCRAFGYKLTGNTDAEIHKVTIELNKEPS